MCLNKIFINIAIIMGYLIIKNFNKKNISIKESKSYYIISYVKNYITLSSIPIILHGVSVDEDFNGFYLKITNSRSIQLLQEIDLFLKNKIKNYKPILQHNDYYNYIFFKKNTYIEKIINLLNETIIINIIKFKKHASHTYPIVYIL